MKSRSIPILIICLTLSGCTTMEKGRLTKNGSKKNDDSKVPSLTSPDVRRVWVPEKIDGTKFIEGHYMYVIEHNSVWSK